MGARRVSSECAYQFRKPWRNGTVYAGYSPLDLIERLAVLVPEPAEPESPVAQCPESTTQCEDLVENFPARPLDEPELDFA